VLVVPCILQAYMESHKMISELKSKIFADYSKLDIEKEKLILDRFL
jgi:hypothetical protein